MRVIMCVQQCHYNTEKKKARLFQPMEPFVDRSSICLMIGGQCQYIICPPSVLFWLILYCYLISSCYFISSWYLVWLILIENVKRFFIWNPGLVCWMWKLFVTALLSPLFWFHCHTPQNKPVYHALIEYETIDKFFECFRIGIWTFFHKDFVRPKSRWVIPLRKHKKKQ